MSDTNVDVDGLVLKLMRVETMPELDALRPETVIAMESKNEETFNYVQKEFIKAKNRLNRIPLSKRGW